MTQFNKPVKTKCWEKFLAHSGCYFVRIRSSHHHWKCPGCLRTVTFWGAKKEVPRFHINSCLRTMSISPEDFNAWEAENC